MEDSVFGSELDPATAMQKPQGESEPHSPNSMDKRITLLEAENSALRARLESLGTDPDNVVVLDDERVLQDVGIYRYHHPLENALAFRERLDDIAARIAVTIKGGTAIEKSNMFTFDGSLAKGRAMTNDLAKLMLRAYNAEAENVVRSLRAGNTVTAIKRLDAARTAIAKLGKMMEMHIGDGFHALRIEEVELTADYLMKKEEEREAARAERERLREERKVELEFAAARERLEKERSHILTVIEKVRANGSSDPDLERKLADIDSSIALNDYRAANIRAGYVYVISNRGAFGDRVVKIGLTRRLEPLDRIYELGDASVPFRFDVHAIFFSEDAVSLENELHERFSARRVNWANNRKEFFFASPADVRTVLSEKLGNLLEFAEHVESTEYLQSVRYWPDHIQPPQPSHATEPTPQVAPPRIERVSSDFR
ncbi:MAG: DUF4041 domain-containing protein [Sulfuritalea sp.]|nr:DUF4041 domain-containing protein [Sulfuritalea sp.]